VTSPFSGSSAPDRSETPARLLEDALFEIKHVVVGQEQLIERVLVALLAGGHCLIEGVPGLAKTLTVATLSRVVGGDFARL
jgi:MoxR-like ATPase